MVPKGTIESLKESGDTMRIRIAMEFKRTRIILRKMIRVEALNLATDVVVLLIMQGSLQLLSIW